jgi:hypothetical protein
MKNCVIQTDGQVVRWLLVIAASLTVSVRAYAVAGVTLADLNSTVTMDPYSQAGVNQWLVDGTSALKQQWFWYRVGSVAEKSIDTLGVPVITSTASNSVKLTYGVGNFDVQVTYTLNGALPGSGTSDLGEQIKINNYTTNAMDFHFFQYSDFNLGASDSVGLTKNLQGKFYRSTQTFGGTELQETVVSPGANHGEVAAAPFTLDRLNDGVATTLNDSVSATGDVTWAFQWDFTIAAGSSAQIGKDKRLTVTVPEPTTAALAGLGLALLVASVRRRLA